VHDAIGRESKDFSVGGPDLLRISKHQKHEHDIDRLPDDGVEFDRLLQSHRESKLVANSAVEHAQRGRQH
jgi:hypothetical protein